MPEWAQHQHYREDRNGMIEDICKKHGVGHPNIHWLNSDVNKDAGGNQISNGSHGCCGCCLHFDD